MKKVLILLVTVLSFSCQPDKCEQVAYKSKVNQTVQKNELNQIAQKTNACEVSALNTTIAYGDDYHLTGDLIKDAKLTLRVDNLFLNGYTVQGNGRVSIAIHGGQNNHIYGPGTIIYKNELWLSSFTYDDNVTFIDACNTLGLEDIKVTKEKVLIGCEKDLPYTDSDGFIYTEH